MTSPHHGPALPADIDPTFVCDFRAYDDPDAQTQRWTTWWDVEPLSRGPEPRPDWVVTSRGAVDTELGILKTGKEADVFLVEREDPADIGSGVVMAAKRYRSTEHRTFHRAAAYTEGWSTRRSRDQRAIKNRSTFGREMAAAQWVGAEWEALKRIWSAGVAVPYPVQVDGQEILMEFIGADGEAAPRLAQTRPEPGLLAHYFEQVREAMALLAQLGVAHGDLSPYNILADGDRIVLIDLPQAVDLTGNLAGLDLLMRDCTNVCRWFRGRGLDVDDGALYADLLGSAF